MNKAMYIHHTINLILMIVLMIFNFTNFGGLPVYIILAVLVLGNAILLIRANKKKVEEDGVTIDDYKKK